MTREHWASTGTRPISVRKVDDDGKLWFLSAADSHKNAELIRNPGVQLYFQARRTANSCICAGPPRSRLIVR